MIQHGNSRAVNSYRFRDGLVGSSVRFQTFKMHQTINFQTLRQHFSVYKTPHPDLLDDGRLSKVHFPPRLVFNLNRNASL